MNSSADKTDVEIFEEQCDNFFAIYQKVGQFCAGIPNEKTIGDERNKLCRFCKKTLNRDAHEVYQ